MQNKVFEACFSATCRLTSPIAKHGQTLDRSLCHRAQALVTRSGLHLARLTQIMRERTHVVRNGFVIVVQHNNKILFCDTSIIDSFQGHAASQSAITNNSDHLVMLALQVTRGSQAKCSRDRGAGMAGTKDIIWTFIAAQVTRKATKLANSMKLLAATGQKFMHISLMPDVPDQQILRRVESIVQGNR